MKGIDLNSYTTNHIAADINDLMNVLEIEEYNLLTMSYSTKIGQIMFYKKSITILTIDYQQNKTKFLRSK